jgi:hypothetical protein
MGSARTWRRPRRIVAPLALVCLALSACTQGDPPGDPVTDPPFALGQSQAPSVHWPQGRPVDDVSDEDASWVATLREWDLLVHASIVIGDISDPRLVQLNQWPLTSDYYSPLVNEIAAVIFYDNPDRARYAPGPTPMIVQSVEKAGTEVHIEVCAPPRWYASETTPDLEGSWRSTGRVLTFTLAEQDGSQVVLKRRVDYDATCSLDTARVGYFDPNPPYQQVPTSTFIDFDGGALRAELYARSATGVIDQDYS